MRTIKNLGIVGLAIVFYPVAVAGFVYACGRTAWACGVSYLEDLLQ